MKAKPVKGATYYGTTPSGVKLHIGTEVWYYDLKAGGYNVRSKCGNDIIECDKELPSPSKVDEFCKVCYRSVAWDYFVAGVRGEHVSTAMVAFSSKGAG